jgi:predicted AAA+ superfamily ATPase
MYSDGSSGFNPCSILRSRLLDMLGLLPSEFVQSGAVSDAFVRDVLDVVQGDIVRSTKLSELEALALLDRLAQNVCSPINLTSVATDIGLRDNERADDRIRGLIENFLAWKCHRAGPGQAPHIRAQPKLYFIDPLVATLAHRRNDAFRLPDASVMNQQQIALAISRVLTARDPSLFVEGTRLLFERTKTDAEIDFVGPDLDAPFDAKYVDDKWRREAQTMRARYGKGVLATRGVIDMESDVWAIPAALIAWLLT